MNKEGLDRTTKMEGGVENVAVEQTKTAETDPFAKGRERMASIGQFFTDAKEKAKGIVSNVGGSISRFWSRAKSVGTETVAAVLSADDLAKKGVEYGKGKIDQAGEWVETKIDSAEDWVCDKQEQVSAFVGRNYDRASNFVSSKAEQVKQFGLDKVELAKDVGFFVKEKSVETLEKAKGGVVRRYEKVKDFGESALFAAKMEASRIKQAYRESMNNLRLRRLEAELARVLEKESAVSARAEQIKEMKNRITEKMSLLSGLEFTQS